MDKQTQEEFAKVHAKLDTVVSAIVGEVDDPNKPGLNQRVAKLETSVGRQAKTMMASVPVLSAVAAWFKQGGG